MKVDLIIGGFQKCGSTALHHFISHHPKIIESNPKELDYFNYHANNRDTEYYHSFFEKKIFARKRGYLYLDGSVSYMADGDPKITADRIFNYNNNIKIVALIRNPVDRAFSAWNMYSDRYKSGRENWWIKWNKKRGNSNLSDIIRRRPEEYSDFHVFVENEIKAKKEGKKVECPVLSLGFYDKGIETFKKKFGENLFIIKNEDLANETELQLNRITSFFNLAEYDWSKFEGEKVFLGKYNNKMKTETRELLLEYYTRSDKRLYELTGYTYK